MSERERAIEVAKRVLGIDDDTAINADMLASALLAEHEHVTKLEALLAQACDQIDACSTWTSPSDNARRVLRGVAGVLREKAAKAMGGES